MDNVTIEGSQHPRVSAILYNFAHACTILFVLFVMPGETSYKVASDAGSMAAGTSEYSTYRGVGMVE